MNDETGHHARSATTHPPLTIPRSVPAVIVRLELEAAPRVICDYLHEGDQRRMLDWLSVHPELLDLIGRAHELRDVA